MTVATYNQPNNAMQTAAQPKRDFPSQAQRFTDEYLINLNATAGRQGMGFEASGDPG